MALAPSVLPLALVSLVLSQLSAASTAAVQGLWEATDANVKGLREATDANVKGLREATDANVKGLREATEARQEATNKVLASYTSILDRLSRDVANAKDVK
jgi:hypothetical protein